MRHSIHILIALSMACTASPTRSLVGSRQMSMDIEVKQKPYDSEVLYIESSGAQFINTGIYPLASVGCRIGYEPTTTSYNDECMIGAGSDSWRWGLSYRYRGVILQISGLSYQGASWANYNISGGYHEIDYNFSDYYTCYLDGDVLRENIPHGSVVSGGPIFLFGFNYNGTGSIW